MGVAGDGAAVIAHSLAGQIGWPVAEWPDQRALHAMVARTLGRREHLVITSAPIPSHEQRLVRGELHGVRFVDLADQRGSGDEVVRAIRYEFGL